MLSRKDSEQREYEILSKDAAKAAESKGRRHAEEKCAFRTDFQRDRDRIIHSKALRRLMHKTQVFIAPEEDHFRTRLTHTLEVAQIARSIARALRLNEDLAEAVAMGHDLGHTPFGHAGESALAAKHPGGFRHNVQSLRVADVLETSGARRGMNLTEEVRDGILNHTGPALPITLEGRVVKTADRIAYVNHDIDDALRGGIITEADLPRSAIALLGGATSKRIDSLIRDMIETSDGTGDIRQSDACRDAMNGLRTFLFDVVYFSGRVSAGAERYEIGRAIPALYDFYMENPGQLPDEYQELARAYGLAETVKDHIAGMTDRYAWDTYEKIRKR
ncbi:MAG: deoxyguanosinetriphosphate triphosphohydrolase [Clostridiales Family XIII bacterium]|jgi:dGTPase|nr:deoxyguanosinetriphosphate triphosphohydrolase [Clostridiales Family XIII bacterium]